MNSYQRQPFHNFEHASHVVLSIVKLLGKMDAVGHNLSLSDPLTKFTVVLAALIHDVDHPGCPNTQLVQEKHPLALAYDNKTVAEQNSFDLAWDLLMKDCYTELRRTIYCDAAGFNRFREVLVHCIVSTDIMDQDLNRNRKLNWSRNFGSDEIKPTDGAAAASVNARKTSILELLLQVSDVAHTMQHWHKYRQWSGRLHEEMYKAYMTGRAANDPMQDLYEGELGFIKFYVIPLSERLDQCGVFGSAGPEYLKYALSNHAEWEAKGQAIAEETAQALANTHKIKVAPAGTTFAI